jgi:hypothetical protein
MRWRFQNPLVANSESVEKQLKFTIDFVNKRSLPQPEKRNYQIKTNQPDVQLNPKGKALQR